VIDRGVLFGTGRPATQSMLSPPLCTTPDKIESAIDTVF
jgi:taurine--2-oxoglutarate transaminase